MLASFSKQCSKVLVRGFANSKIRIFFSESNNPHLNLATEDWIFNDLDPSYQTLFLWRNAPTVVIGRYQNPWKECYVDKMNESDVFLARRRSGGGAVYHDLGNTNFTFLSPKEDYSKTRNNEIICNALSTFGVEAVSTGRNDIHVDDKKVSGAAFKEKKDRAFHHGTMLIDVDMTQLPQYLNPDKAKLQSKGIKSVQARVANLSSINPEIDNNAFCEAVCAEFKSVYDADCEYEFLSEESVKSNTDLLKYYEELSSWDWRFGKTPDFSHNLEKRFVWGNMDLHLDVHQNVVRDSVIYSDCLVPDLVSELQENLIGCPYDHSSIAKAIDTTSTKLGESVTESCTEIKEWLMKEL
eukprot:TRINITY_DN1143_c0_g2_i1.p1 TRINITY_DN1143_c0_g2~~TRINITY_DN1143_c0_g2_i1.p1  ORF type:complete len:353 (-),score=73.26 TRINITY_DN1143_c0_g2_i1:264-1322(-)